MELHGEDNKNIRIANMPKHLETLWSKRHQQMQQSARELGFSLASSASRAHAVQRITRAPKTNEDHDTRQARWDEECAYIDRETLLASVVDELERHAELTPEQLRDFTATLDALPQRLTQTEAVFLYPDLLGAVHLATPGLLDHQALETALARALRHPDIIQLPSRPTAEATAGMAHTRLYTSRPTLELEHAITAAAARMSAAATHTLPPESVQTKVTELRRGGYPLSDEQIDAIHAAAHAQVTLIEGAAGSGKTTTLRPIVDLYREQGYTAIGAATAWITANTLGADCDIEPFSIAKLLADARKGRLTLDDKTLLIVDEAGMLSSREIHNVLRLCEANGAKLILAGDTEQQQPIEAGPGLRLARDGANSVQVNQIRRQLPDLEDVLIHAHGETPETARLTAAMTPPAMRGRLMADYEAMADKPDFQPWQVAASEAFRDGKAGEAIAAYHARGHVHLCRRKEATLERLADDWARYQRENPGKTSAALVRTNAERQALSERLRLRQLDPPSLEQSVTVTVGRRQTGRDTMALDIAPGERLRIGATHWEKQLYNGDVVIVDALEVSEHPDGGEPSVLIKGHTTRGGRDVTFRHDEILDWYGNIRLSHGYALTFASAQGLTVDHAFLLADEKPARETIYPAATRHREGLDIYIDRRPAAFDIEAQRPEDQAGEPVSDQDVLELLARRWSRAHPKVAATDYFDTPEQRDHALLDPTGTTRLVKPLVTPRAVAIDNTISSLGVAFAEALTHRHRHTITDLTAGHDDLLERFEILRQRFRDGETDAARTPEYTQAIEDAAEFLERAAPYRAQPLLFNPYLHRFGNLTQHDFDHLETLLQRAIAHRQSTPLPAPAPSPASAEPPAPAHAAPISADQAKRLTRFLAGAAAPDPADPAGRYLARYSLDAGHAANLRFHPTALLNTDGKRIAHPALLAPVRTHDGQLEAVHRLYLTPNGIPAPLEQPARTSGSPRAGAVWLTDPANAKRIVLCERITDALSVAAMLPPNANERVCIAAALSSTHAPAVELPPAARELLFIHNNDDAGNAAWDALRERHAGNTTLSVSRLHAATKSIHQDWLKAPELLASYLTPQLTAPLWRETHRQLHKDWTTHFDAADRAGVPITHHPGYDTLITRLRSLTARLEHEHGPAPQTAARDLEDTLANHNELVTQWRANAEELLDEHEELTAYAKALGRAPFYVEGYDEHITPIRALATRLHGVQIPELTPLAAKLDDILNERRTLMTGLKELSQHTAALKTHTLARQRITESAARDKYARPVFHPEYPAWRREADQLIAATRRYFASGQPALAPHLVHAPFAKQIREGAAALDTHIRHDRRYYRSDQEQHNHAYPTLEQQERGEQMRKHITERLTRARTRTRGMRP